MSDQVERGAQVIARAEDSRATWDMWGDASKQRFRETAAAVLALDPVSAREERLREALRRVERVLDPSPGMPRPRDAVRDQALIVVREALTDE